jgi:hypothetical protein
VSDYLELEDCRVGMYVIGHYDLGNITGIAGRWGRITAVGVDGDARGLSGGNIEVEWHSPPDPEWVEKNLSGDNGFAHFVVKKAQEEPRTVAGPGWFRGLGELELLAFLGAQ